MAPNPVFQDEVRRPSKVTRRVLCSYYEKCLDVAVEKGWSGFSCSQCEAFHLVSLNESAWLEDAMACRALLAFTYFPEVCMHHSPGRLVELQREDPVVEMAIGW